MSPSKYKAKKIECDDGKFDSQGEYKRWLILKGMQDMGLISNLQRQVSYELIPQQKLREPRVRKGRSHHYEMPVKYIADFVYEENGQTIVEDYKGMRLSDYVIKRKLMKFIHDIEIREVK